MKQLDPTASPRIKICCISSEEEMWMAVNAGARALGFVSRMPSGPGPIDESLIAELVAKVPAGIATFLLTCETSAPSIIEQQRRTRVNTLQLVDTVAPGTHHELRRAIPGISLVQVLHVTGPETAAEAAAIAGEVDALLLDSGNPRLAVKELGGTGRRHDWNVSRQIRDGAGVPVYLAGGLNSGNVREALNLVRPFGLDVCSGVRTEGRLDRARLSDFIRAAKSGQ